MASLTKPNQYSYRICPVRGWLGWRVWGSDERVPTLTEACSCLVRIYSPSREREEDCSGGAGGLGEGNHIRQFELTGWQWTIAVVVMESSPVCYTPLGLILYHLQSPVCYSPMGSVCNTPLGLICYTLHSLVFYTLLGPACYTPLGPVC